MIPIIGGKEEDLSCVYLVGSNAFSGIYMDVCWGRNAMTRFNDLQEANFFDLTILDAFWFPDIHLARRVRTEAMSQLYPRKGNWLALVNSKEIGKELNNAASRLRIPLMSNREYKKICAGPKERRDNEIKAFVKKYGFMGVQA